jgi:hypothetical protein
MYQIIARYTEWPQNIPDGRKIDQMAIKYTNNFHCKALQNLPKLGFVVCHLATLLPATLNRNRWKKYHLRRNAIQAASQGLDNYFEGSTKLPQINLVPMI